MWSTKRLGVLGLVWAIAWRVRGCHLFCSGPERQPFRQHRRRKRRAGPRRGRVNHQRRVAGRPPHGHERRRILHVRVRPSRHLHRQSPADRIQDGGAHGRRDPRRRQPEPRADYARRRRPDRAGRRGAPARHGAAQLGREERHADFGSDREHPDRRTIRHRAAEDSARPHAREPWARRIARATPAR